ncbi:MAG TPA: valine--tRNA ligase [Bacilli bacterium]|nr:valine--tRNA ligase [Bacilli bacterium]
MLEKKYDHKSVEEGKYKFWKENDYFKSGDLTKEPFCIVIPPPNVTGRLHIGHAWDTTMQDIVIRYKKMCGYDCLWLPGMDHAGIATQAVVDRRLKSLGYEPRKMAREDWLKYAWSWKEEYANIIREQWAKLGLSLDYSKERFTLDDGLNRAVNEVFVNLYNKGYIYRGKRIINWDPEAQTALSNEEVIYKDVEGAFYHIKYLIEDSNDYLEIATTRPETLFGDTAVAVNPNDERYNNLIGKNVILPIVNKLIPIIGDEHADPLFGTGVVKITPAHDPNDFEVGVRHNLDQVVCIAVDGTMNENALQYNGMDRFECRNQLVKDLESVGLLIKIEKIVHSVGHSERTNVMVEPYLSEQWFVKMNDLAKNVLDNQKNKNNKVNFIPKRFEKILTHWMEDCHDWCISRQLWWGHRIPAWYKNEEIYIGLESPKGEGWVQDNDVLDTWFSSALWPFSTLGWPDDSELLKRYYPTNILITGYDIIFFWVCRMVFQGLEFMGKRPFKDCLIHGLIRDKDGRKMSKSLGNGVDPMDIIEEYGADSLRYFLSTNSAPGQDLRFDELKIKSTWNFINKLWNASRFVMMNLEDFDKNNYDLSNLSLIDKWILTKCNRTILEVTKSMDRYEFNNVATTLYDFIWSDFCDNYIELSKNALDKDSTKSTLLYVLTNILKMLHPIMPFVTEEIYMKLENDSIMLAKYPKVDNNIYNEECSTVDKIIADIIAIRNLKANNDIKKNAKILIEVSEELKNIYIAGLKIKSEDLVKDPRSNCKSYNYKSALVDITFYQDGESINTQAIANEISVLETSISRRKQLLENENYINKAPKNIVELDKLKLVEEQDKLNNLREML